MLLGPPASGKGTQSEMIQSRFGIEPTSPGAMLRAELQAGTEIGKEADALTSRGLLVPDSLVIALVDRWLQAHNDAFVFDGFPRTLAQAEALEEILKRRGTPLETVLYFNVPFETILDRVLHRLTCEKCGRIYSVRLHFGSGEEHCPACGGNLVRRRDDTAEALEHRMIEYREKTEPLVEFYRTRGLLAELAAAERPETVFAEVVNLLEAA